MSAHDRAGKAFSLLLLSLLAPTCLEAELRVVSEGQLALDSEGGVRLDVLEEGGGGYPRRVVQFVQAVSGDLTRGRQPLTHTCHCVFTVCTLAAGCENEYESSPTITQPPF